MLPSDIRAHLTSDLCILLRSIGGFDKKASMCGHFVTTRHCGQFRRVEIEIRACRFFENMGAVLGEPFSRSSMRKRFYPTQSVLFRRMIFAPDSEDAKRIRNVRKKGLKLQSSMPLYDVDHLNTAAASHAAASLCRSRN